MSVRLPTQLLGHFNRISEAPDAVARLRRFILDLAVRGKLVEQDSKDEPAAELLKRIEAEKDGLTPRRQDAKKEKPLALVEPHEFLFEVPPSWVWGYLGDVARYGIPDKVGSNKEISADVWVLDLEDIEKDTSRLIERVLSSARPFRSTKTVFKRGDVLFGKLRPYLNKVLVADSDGVCTTEIIPIRGYCEIVPEYTKLVLKSPLTMEQVDRLMYGMKMPRLGTNDAIALNFPLPPLAEQHRIVAKVDELMALCDQLESAKNERAARRDRLVAASLHRINHTHRPLAGEEAGERDDSATPLPEAARFHLDHLPRLTTRPEHIKQLRQTILNLAVRGSLSKSAAWALKSQPLKIAATLQNGYAFKSEWFTKAGIRLLRNANVSHGVLRWDDLACLPFERGVEFERFHLNEGDVVLSLDRPFIVTGTKVARVSVGDLPCLLLQRVGRFQLNPNLLTSDYLFLWIQSPQFTNQIDPGRSNGVPHISSKQVEGAEIFLPPLAEQHRIVAMVDELMALCDQLETQLTTTKTDSQRLLEAVLRDLLAA